MPEISANRERKSQVADDRTSAPPRRLFDPELAAMQVMMPAIDIADVPEARRIEKELAREMRAARTQPADGQPPRIDAKIGGVLRDPRQREPAIIQGRRKRVLRREPVVEREHRTPHAGRVGLASIIFAVQATCHEAAAVDEQ